MSAAPGWYDAGTPGRLRYWDGTQWTAHETADRSGPIIAPQGWYPAKGNVTRWWDGRVWTGMRFKNGSPSVDWAVNDQPGLAWVAGLIWIVLATAQLALGLSSHSFPFIGVFYFPIALLSIAVAIQTTLVRRQPAPSGEPLMTEVVRPLPGEQEGPGSGWYPISSSVQRWWTGQRWAPYINNRFGIRPSFQGERKYRRHLISTAVIGAIGLIGIILGSVFLAHGFGISLDELTKPIGYGLLFGGIMFLVASVILLATKKFIRNLLFLPAFPPQTTR